MTLLRRLGVRMFLSYLAVLLLTAGVVFGATRLLAPTFFRTNLEQRGPPWVTTVPTTGTSGGGGQTSQPSAPGGTGDQNHGSGPATTGGPGGSGSEGSQPHQDGSQPGGQGGSGGNGAGGDGSGGAALPYGLVGGGLTLLAAPSGPLSEPAADITQAFLDAIDRALVLAVVAGTVVGAVFAALITRRIVRPVEAVRDTARRLAAGDYHRRAAIPGEPALAALATDVNTLAENLENTERRRAELISEVAHELRTPLTTIQGYMEGLLDGVIDAEPGVYASVADEASRLQRVVADLGLLSRLDEATLELNREPLDVGALASEVAERLRPQFAFQRVTLEVAPPPGLIVDGDRDRLIQVFTNLVGNALGHTPPGGSVVLGGSRLEGRVEVSVTDTGEGIAPQNLERVFDRFFRVDGEHRHGVGLGLTIARSLVRAHDGELSAESDGVGRGSRFVVRLPTSPGGVNASADLEN